MAKKKDIEIETFTAPKQIIPDVKISKENQKLLLMAAGAIVLVSVVLGVLYFFGGSLLPKEKVVATVNGEKILQKDYQSLLDAQRTFYTKIYPEQTKQKVSDEFIKGLPQLILDKMIQEKVLSQYLAEKKVVVTDKQVKDYVEKEIVATLYKGDEKEYEAFLEKNGTTLENTLTNIRSDLVQTKAIEVAKIRSIEFDEWYIKEKAKTTIVINKENL